MPDPVDVLAELSNYIFLSKYARYLPKERRRETWDEAVNRVLQMHLKKFSGSKLTPAQRARVRWAFEMVRAKKVLPSMRSLQFSGPAVEAINARMFNCCVRHIDSIRAFAEVFYLLLCGCGVGFGVSKKHVGIIPELVSAKDRTGTTLTYVVEDSIEGWADSIEALLLCYTKGNPFSGRKVVMDFSRIRPRGAPLKTGGGKAPGYLPLKNAHRKIKELLEDRIEVRGQKVLRPIDVYDILMHTSDAVLAGGIRRSATICIFDKDDVDMLGAKTGDWFTENPQRARSNNSALLLRNDLSFEEFRGIIERTKQFGEPGFIFSNHKDALTNPCQPGWAPVLTPNGIRKITDICIGDSIWSETGWTTVTDRWSTGKQEVFRYRTTAGVFYGTKGHRLVSNGVKTKATNCQTIDVLNGPGGIVSWEVLDADDVMAGLVIGDGSRHIYGAQCYLTIGGNDGDYFHSEIANLISKCAEKGESRLWRAKTEVQHEELVPLPDRVVPDRYFEGSQKKVAGFLRGLFSANGSVVGSGVGNRVTLKSTSPRLVEQAQMMLSSLGIRSYVTTNEPKTVSFSNGDYLCRRSYDINIGVDRLLFAGSVGFIQTYKNEKIVPNRRISSYKKNTYDIISVDFVGEQEVFDITVDNETHTYWTGNHNVSNCAEINFLPITKDGRSGVQFCNLTSVNGSLVTSEQDFIDAAEAAAIVGTLQASYTDFPYLSAAAKELTEEEALLGVSITAMMEHPTILLDPVLQQKAARKAVETNKLWAGILKIKQAARVTTIKPEGSGSLVVGTMASGIHAAEDLWMFRRVQANKFDPVYLYFQKANPHLCEESVWSANKTDDVITFPIKVPDGSLVKRDLTALDHLGMIKSTQENWVLTGTTEANRKPVSHSVSCTVLVKEHEWEQVAHYLYMNREFFSAVSLLPDDGSKRYQQAPVEGVSTEEEFKKFHALRDTMVSVDYSTLVETEDGTSHVQEAACAGPEGCELI